MKFRDFLSLVTALAFFGATAVNATHGITLGSCLSLISGTAFLLGTCIDLEHRKSSLG